MTLRLQYQTLPFGGFTNFNPDANNISDLRLRIGDSHPAVLSWTWHGPNHQTPIPRLAFVRFWDDTQRTEATPNFEGYVEDVVPGDDGHTVEYRAYDPTRRAANEITCFDEPWPEGTPVSGSTGTRPVPDSTAVPRVIYNAKIDNDPDYSHSIEDDLIVGDIIADLLEYQKQPLYWLNACPEASPGVPGSPYKLNSSSGTGTGDELSAMDFKPQEKLVFESEGLRSAITRTLQQYAPNYRLLFEPGARQWRFYDLTQAPQQTLALNEFGGTYKVLSLSLEPSLEERFTAVRIYGPPTTVVAAPGGEGDVGAFSTAPVGSGSDGTGGGLTTLGSGYVLETYNTSTGFRDAVAYTQFQIVDENKRRGAKMLSRTVTVPMVAPKPDLEMLGYEFIPVKSPTLQLSFDNGSTWMTILGTFFDFKNGIANSVNPIYYYVSPAPVFGSTQTFFVPTTYRLIWAYYASPLSVRKPSSGFEGTAYTDADLESVFEVYDESLAVGYEYGTPVTTATRRAQFEKLAQQLLDERKNIVWTGGCTLEGLKYEFASLNRRINFTSEDADGAALTTGWESINAFLTDVEYDFTMSVTTLTFSSDQMALMRVDVERLKEKLKIRALNQTVVHTVFIPLRTNGYQPTTLGGRDARDQLIRQHGQELGSFASVGQPGMEAAGVIVNNEFQYIDPETGEVET
jgi:hypothetical protein